MIVDLTQADGAKIPTEIAEHSDIWNGKAIGQLSKPAPLLLFGQRTNQGVETKRARQ